MASAQNLLSGHSRGDCHNVYIDVREQFPFIDNHLFIFSPPSCHGESLRLENDVMIRDDFGFWIDVVPERGGGTSL